MSKGKPKQPAVTARDIVEALRGIHTNDVFVPECKNGPSWTGAHSRLDVWTMNRSWAKARIVGYEIKVSRSDFQQDTKWPSYLPMCNELYFVCPKGLIDVTEVPDGVGLYYCLGKRVRVVKKASWREITIPDQLARYLLMCRTRIVDAGFYENDTTTHEAKLKYWQKWLEERKESADLGYSVSRAVRDHCSKLETENTRLKAENANLAHIRDLANRHGLPIFGQTWNLEDKVKEATRIFPNALTGALANLIHQLGYCKAEIEKLTLAQPQQKAA